MKTLTEQLRTYESYHTKQLTKITHFIGVPLVTFSVLILLSWIKIGIPTLFMTNLAWLFLLGTLVYYYLLDFQLAMLMTLILIPFTLLAILVGHAGPHKASIITFLVLFIGGWLFQLLGHFMEGKRPALVDNFSQIFIAPLFLLVEVLFMLGKRKDLQ